LGLLFIFGAKFIIMAIKKQFLKTKNICKVTFTVPAENAESVAVLGDFNNWDPKANTLKKLKNGTFKGVFDIEKDSSYEFRYLIDNTYINDEQADSYKWNDYANAENSVLSL
jgi:1,4-alpha-glucan branching enzyme